MNWDQIAGSWTEFSGKVREKWGKLTDDDLDRVCEIFPVLAERRRQLAGTLSGGEQQMLAMGRALMARPRMLMLDEPSMGLAPLVVRDIFEIIVRIAASGSTVLLVEQNARSAFKVAHRGYVLETGTVVLQGTSEELLANRDVQRAYLGKDASEASERRTP
jgi:branched-chain amino acid transport system ATP-binding protein